MDNELILFDRLEVIKTTISKYGEENFYISFSGGKDSTVLSKLIDLALPNNRIPRVFANTGIEYNAIVEFVKDKAERDNRVQIIKPSKNVRATLEEYGYPFKSKDHSQKVDRYQRNGKLTPHIKKYLERKTGIMTRYQCPEILMYQFTPVCSLKISDRCCVEMKEKPLLNWAKANGKTIDISGLMRAEQGRRTNTQCFVDKGKYKRFHPLAVVSKEWEEWFIEREKIKLCKLYFPPYNFERTGCKGCPFTFDLQDQLETMGRYLPQDREQCEVIWKPVYDEYRRLGYRLDKAEQTRLI